MKTAVQVGDVLDYANGETAISSGDVVAIGEMIGVAIADIAANETGAVAIKGVISVTKVGSQAWSVGDKIFWDKTNLRFTKTASSDADTLAGYAVEAVGSGAGETTGKVLLIPGLGKKAAAVAALAGTLTGTTDGTLADVADIALSTSNTYTDAAVNAAVNTAIAAVNLQLKELQTTLNAALASLKAAGGMDN